MKYTVDDLMRITGETEVEVRGTKKKYYLRTLGATHEDGRRNHALSKSRMKYQELQGKTGEDYEMYVLPLEGLSTEDMVRLGVALKRAPVP